MMRSLFALGLMALSAWGCGPRNRPPDRLILVTVDTLRADHVGAYGYPLQTTPFIDSLAAQGVVFRQSFAQAPTTGPSHASMFTGLFPIQHGVEANGRKLDEGLFTLAEAMSSAGYQTAAFVSTNAHFKWGNLSQGFEVYDEQPIPERKKSGKRSRQYRSAAATVDAALDWLADIPEGEKLFLWIHLYDPHKSLQPPDEYLERIRQGVDRVGRKQHRKFLRAAHGPPKGRLYKKILKYDAEILFADRQLERLYLAMATESSRDLWIVTSDHGQGLDSHKGWFGHARQIYNTQLSVPLIFHATNQSLLPAVVEGALVEHVDLVPTLAEIVGFEFVQELGQMRGASLVPYLLGERPERPKTFSFAQNSRYKGRRGSKANRSKPKFSLQSLKYKYILNEGKVDEFFLVDTDPNERTNLIDDPEVEKQRTQMQELLVTSIETLPNPDIEVEAMDEETLERLKALGYLQ